MKILFNGHQGTLFHIQTTVNQVNTREVWDNTEKKKFIDAVFLQVMLANLSDLNAIWNKFIWNNIILDKLLDCLNQQTSIVPTPTYCHFF